MPTPTPRVNEQFFDVYDLASERFILRATLPALALIYRWHRAAEERILRSGTAPIDLFGNGRHEDVRVIAVVNDWQPEPYPVD